ncbi:MAG: hypothetical protein KA369_11735 [Spirochaetes bacterium]|nr:hypothetical protein [Spirochaetota bacterium]
MKKLALFFVVVFAVSAFAQDKSAAKFVKSDKIKISLSTISLEKYGPAKEDKTFKAGESVFINLEMKGLEANDQGQVVVQADLSVPQLSLDKKNLIDGSTGAEDVVPMYFEIPIGSVQKGGTCFVKITVRDMVAKTFVEFNTTFLLAK